MPQTLAQAASPALLVLAFFVGLGSCSLLDGHGVAEVKLAEAALTRARNCKPEPSPSGTGEGR